VLCVKYSFPKECVKELESSIKPVEKEDLENNILKVKSAILKIKH